MTNSANSPEKKRQKKKKLAESDRVETGRVEKKMRFLWTGRFQSFDRPPISVFVGKDLNRKICVGVGEGANRKYHDETLVVAKTFHIHEDVLGASSFFLSDVLKNGLNDSTVQSTLSTITPSYFETYLNWLYTGRFHIVFDGRFQETMEWARWKRCYELGNILQDCTFKDALFDMLIEKLSAEDPNWAAYQWSELQECVYLSSTRESPHRKFVIDIAVHVWPEMVLKNERKSIEYLPTEFYRDLIAALAVKGRAARIEHVSAHDFLKDIDTCVYHEHTYVKPPNSILPCYKTKYGA